MGGKRPGRGAPAKRSVPAVLAAEGAGVGPRGHPAELRMWPLLVVITPPGLQYGTGVRQRFEQRLVQQLIAQAAVEALDEAGKEACSSLRRVGIMPVRVARADFAIATMYQGFALLSAGCFPSPVCRFAGCRGSKSRAGCLALYGLFALERWLRRMAIGSGGADSRPAPRGRCGFSKGA
jgi:hypothetical protein